MDTLPDELKGWIFDYCDVAQIKSLRLTCRSIQDVADERLLQEVVLVMNRDSLEACHGVAAHPIFSKTAKSLWIQADRPRQETFEEWDGSRKGRICGAAVSQAMSQILKTTDKLPKAKRSAATSALMSEADARAKSDMPVLSDDQAEYHFGHALRVASEATEIFDDGSLLRCLRHILENTNVQTVDLTMGNHVRVCSTEKNKSFAKAMIRPLGDLDEAMSGLDAMVELVLAASEIKFTPRELRLGSLSHLIFLREDLAGKFQDLLVGVEELAWIFSVPVVGGDYDLDDDAFEELIQDFGAVDNKFLPLMKAAKELKRLNLDLPWHWDAEVAVQLDNVVGGITWQNLTNVRVASFETSADQLKDFLLRHGDTLVTVELGNVQLQEGTGTWSDCFAAFACELPHVQNFQLRGSFGREVNSGPLEWYYFGLLEEYRNNHYGEQVSRYLINGGERCPPRPSSQEQDYWREDSDDSEDEEHDEDMDDSDNGDESEIDEDDHSDE